MSPESRLEPARTGPRDWNASSFEHAIGVVGSRAPYERHLEGMAQVWNFATAELTEKRLSAAGFASVRCYVRLQHRRPPSRARFEGGMGSGSGEPQ